MIVYLILLTVKTMILKKSKNLSQAPLQCGPRSLASKIVRLDLSLTKPNPTINRHELL